MSTPLDQILIRHEPTDVTVMFWNSAGGLDSSTCSATPMPNEPEGTWLVNRIHVPPPRRRRGIGTMLMSTLKYALRERGCRVLIVAPGGYDLSREEQIAFYKTCGFVLVGQPDDVGLDWWMEWKPTLV